MARAIKTKGADTHTTSSHNEAEISNRIAITMMRTCMQTNAAPILIVTSCQSEASCIADGSRACSRENGSEGGSNALVSSRRSSFAAMSSENSNAGVTTVAECKKKLGTFQ